MAPPGAPPADAAAFGKRTYAEASGPSRAGRTRPRGPPLPEGSLAGRATLHPARLPGLRHTGMGSGHIPKIQSLSDAPTGKGFQSQPPRGRRKSRRDALSANTATVPRGERLQTHLPRLLGQARRPRGGRAARWFPLEGDRRPHRNGAGSAGGIRWNQAPPPVRGAAQRSVCGSRALPVSAVRAGSVLWPKEAACPAGDPRRPRGERHPARLPGKGTAATCRTASGFRPRPLP